MLDKAEIRARILELVSQEPSGLSVRLAAEFKTSRQTASRHIQALIEEGLIQGTGKTKGREYQLSVLDQDTRRYAREGLSEDVVWRESFSPHLADLSENVRAIWQYGVTEMVNNAIDHSGSSIIAVGIQRNSLYSDGWVADDGEGIFLKIQRALGLYDPRESILELAKGKLTTEPERHTGEGIFFTSKVFDRFDIRSGRLHFLHDGEPLDLILERPDDAPGTVVIMRLANQSTRTTKAVFDEFAPPEEFSFAKTIVPVRLALYEGENLVSRSQAKRLYMRFERFQNVVLDFTGVAEIGQAFADELFRVFAEAHPSVKLAPTNMSDAVKTMLSRVSQRS
jgi:DNA-binding MarR family transcriptional regulator